MTHSSVNIADVEKIIRHVADTEILPRFKNLQETDIREKNPGDLVTIADESAEVLLSKLLTDLLPGSCVVGEESVAKNSAVLDLFNNDAPVWVIDPIDGTYNFTHGRSDFGILVALIYKGVTEYAFAYDIIGKRMATAKKGHGTFVNSRRTRIVTQVQNLHDMTGQGGGAQAWHFKPVADSFKEIINLRCSLHDFMNFLHGEADFIIHANKVTPWDQAAGCLLSEEAGGCVLYNDGSLPYDPTYLGPAFLVVGPSKNVCQKIYAAAYKKLTS